MPAAREGRASLNLSSVEELAEWIGETPDARLVNSLDAARAVITEMVVSFADGVPLPPPLHRAALMTAAAMHERRDSVFGVEAFAVGAADGVGFLTSDPTITKLLAPYLSLGFGGAPAVLETV